MSDLLHALARQRRLNSRDKELMTRAHQTPEEKEDTISMELQPHNFAELDKAISSAPAHVRATLQRERANLQRMQAQRLRFQVTGRE